MAAARRLVSRPSLTPLKRSKEETPAPTRGERDIDALLELAKGSRTQRDDRPATSSRIFSFGVGYDVNPRLLDFETFLTAQVRGPLSLLLLSLLRSDCTSPSAAAAVP